jgi:hypothetical protein
MFDAMPLDQMAKDYDLEASASPVEFLQAMAQDLGAKTGEIETGNLQGYPAALMQILGEFDETSYIWRSRHHRRGGERHRCHRPGPARSVGRLWPHIYDHVQQPLVL